MFPYSSLPENLAAFCDSLRRQHGFHIGPRELHDAARALAIAPLASERAVRDHLRPILSHTRDDVRVFDDAFQAFFHRRTKGHSDAPVSYARADDRRGRGIETPAPRTAGAENRARPDSATHSPGGSAVEMDIGDEPDDSARTLRLAYSPLEGEGAPPTLEPPEAASRDAARTLVRRFELGLLRRWRPASRGTRFDFRRTLRSSTQTAGEAVVFRWRARPKRRPRIVVVVDASRSMGGHAQTALACAVALASATSNVEVFTFSTSLERITRDVRRAAAGERRQLPLLRSAWGGGTSIGPSLQALLRRFGDRLLTRDTIVFIASDGLDVGNPQLLREAMIRLRRQAAAIVWLNPLLESSGYEPVAEGMRVARPHVSTFTWVRDATGLERLSRVVAIRR